MNLKAIPVSLKEANAFVDELHRHHNHAVGDKFRVGVSYDGKLVGIAQVGRPVSRHLDDGKTLEVIRLCTDGTKNACTFLYSRCARIAQEMGYEKIITYILDSESGISLQASGWHCESKEAGGGSWSSPSRPREIVVEDLFGTKEKYPINKKQRWAKELT